MGFAPEIVVPCIFFGWRSVIDALHIWHQYHQVGLQLEWVFIITRCCHLRLVLRKNGHMDRQTNTKITRRGHLRYVFNQSLARFLKAICFSILVHKSPYKLSKPGLCKIPFNFDSWCIPQQPYCRQHYRCPLYEVDLSPPAPPFIKTILKATCICICSLSSHIKGTDW